MVNATLEPNESAAPVNERWTVAQAEKNGLPMLIRFRSERPQGVQSASYPFLISATWSYSQANPAGMPSSEELESMSRFEDALEAALETSQSAYLMVILTSNGDRDWLWYSRSEEETMRLVNQALKGHTKYPVQFAIQKDPGWKAYGQFESGSSGSAKSGSVVGFIQSAVAKLLNGSR
jgi:hypothetical protein